ncbi:MAG: hypothetical protein IPK19_22645 [Chloroflexi bacterium]|nr:hypothetical protein [Chloroflexota bacterium]
MTSSPTDVTVLLDDRLRLISAVLALTDYPDQEKARHGHGSHLHARNTRKQLAEHSGHPAVADMQSLLNLGAPLDVIFTLALLLDAETGAIDRPPNWLPAHWGPNLSDFYLNTAVRPFWQKEEEYWLRAVDEAARALEGKQFKPFLELFVGAFPEQLVFVPNISYPTVGELGLRLGGSIVLLVPPRIAWGESPPWPYDEDPAHVYRAVIATAGQMLMMDFLRANAANISLEGQKPLPLNDAFMKNNPTWAEQFTYLFVTSAVAIFLEDHASKQEADAHVLMERRVTGLDVLPAAIQIYRRYLREVRDGKYSNILDFIPHFSRQLRITHRVGKM